MRQLAILALIIFTDTCVESQTENSKKVCELPKHEGDETCSNSIEIRWFFNKTSCQPFIFKGCGGNDNNFGRFDDCQRLCEEGTHTHFDSPKYICFKKIIESIPEKKLTGLPIQSGNNEDDKDIAQVCFKVMDYWTFNNIAKKTLPTISVQSEEDDDDDVGDD